MMRTDYLGAWRTYFAALRAGTLKETARAKFLISGKKSLNLLDTSQSGTSGQRPEAPIWHKAIKETANNNSPTDIMEEEERKLFDLGMTFVEAGRKGRYWVLEEMAQAGFNPNFEHPRHGMTALHFVASRGTKRHLRALLKFDDIDFLVKDKSGRLPSLMALMFNWDNNRWMSRYLNYREKKQAEDQGINYYEYSGYSKNTGTFHANGTKWEEPFDID